MLKKVLSQIILFLFENRVSIFSFLLIGASTAVIYFSLFALLSHVLRFNYQISVVIAYLSSTLFHFFANRHVAFKGAGEAISGQALKYILLVIMNTLITVGTVTLVVEQAHYSPYFGMVAGIAVTMVVTYLTFYFWIFTPTLDYSEK